MRRIDLRANQIITADVIRDMHMLKVYFNVFNGGGRNLLPPSIVVNKCMIDREAALTKFVNKSSVLGLYAKLDSTGADYLLLDGHHKSVAETLCHFPVRSFEVCSNDDLEILSRMEGTGEIFGFPHKEKNIVQLANGYAEFLIHGGIGALTLEEMTKLAVKDGEFPEYMVEMYNRK